MARTLIIRNASFLTNKVATVTFTSVPCTGISLASDEITITGQEQVEVEYTVTPSDTTDAITWASSNTDIITVSDGVITVVGVGTCTITVTCGTYSDTASVSVTIYAIPDWIMRLVTASTSNHTILVNQTSANRVVAIGDGSQSTEYKIYDAVTVADSKPAIKLPGNTGRIKISVTDGTNYYNGDYANVYWEKDESAGFTHYLDAIYYDQAEAGFNIRTETTKIITVPSGINAFTFVARLASDASSLADAKAVITASGLKIEFLPPAE